MPNISTMQSVVNDPFRNMECLRESIFDKLHDVPVKPSAPQMQRRSWFASLFSKKGVPA